MGAVAPRPALSTHPYSKLLGFLAFSHDSSFSTLSRNILAIRTSFTVLRSPASDSDSE
jgi:hypothetical protein